MDDEWKDAIEEEYGDSSVDASVEDNQEDIDNEGTNTDTESGDDTTDSGDATENEDSDHEGADENEAEDSVDDDDEEEDIVDTDSDEADKGEQNNDEEVEKPSTREEIKAALRELQNESATRETGIAQLKDEVLGELYPEGIDRQLRDADGDPISGIQDLTGIDPQTGKQIGDGLINPVTGEVFTEEEAGRYILRGQQKLNEQVELMENQAYKIAETQLSLKDSSERVEAKFGAVLDALPPEVTKQIADAYIKTLQRDPKSGIVIGAPLDAYEFYSIALAGADQFIRANPPKEAPKPAPTPKAPADRSDRADLGQRGTPVKKSRSDKEWEEAFEEVLG